MIWIRNAIPWLFLALALAFGALMVWVTPPFLMADEQTHLMRADIMTSGPAALSHRVSLGREHVIGRVHQAIPDAAAPFEHAKFQSSEKVQRSDFAAAPPTLDGRWTATYPGQALNPAFYLPSAAAVAWGRHFGWRVLDTLYLARTLNLLASVGLGFVALLLARQARLPIYAILLLPMSVALDAAVSQDGPMIGLAAVAAAILSRAIGEDRPLRGREQLALAACVAAVGMAKPPYAVFALLLLAAPTQDRRTQRLAAAAALAIPLLWNGWMSAAGWAPPDPPGEHTDAVAQALRLVHAPGQIAPLVAATFGAFGEAYAQEFVGVLGWLDTVLPTAFYTAAYWMLGVALLAPAAYGARAWRGFKALTPVVALVAAAGVFLSLYLAWTSLGVSRIEGVQGRYLIPLALMLPLALEGPRPWLAADPVRSGLQLAATIGVLAFPIVSLVVTQRALIERFFMR
jgi:uncharacterized membrane protein